MRLFVAAALDVKTREGVGDMIGACRQHAEVRSGSIKWIEPASLHLTLAFLGEVAPEAVSEVQATLGRPWRQPAFWVALSGQGRSPWRGSPGLSGSAWAPAGQSCGRFTRRSRHAWSPLACARSVVPTTLT